MGYNTLLHFYEKQITVDSFLSFLSELRAAEGKGFCLFCVCEKMRMSCGFCVCVFCPYHASAECRAARSRGKVPAAPPLVCSGRGPTPTLSQDA